uniref:G-protein coupled receptors family 1 profile domain-containing protein n=1 Tax=Ascaris lumbricoides TaxID=6252 RepID=A0A0M3IS66_ASCLU
MLVAIVTEFLLFNFLAFANNVLELIFESFANSKYFQLLVEVSTLLVNLNGATTIIIYLIFGSKYRNVFRKIVGTAFNSLARRQKSWKSKENCHPNEVTLLIMSNEDGVIKKRSTPPANSSVTLVNSNAFTQNGTFVLLNHDEAAMI